MFRSKLIVPIIRRIHGDVPRFAFRKTGCNDKITCKKPQVEKKTGIPSRCKEYAERLAQCPKPARKPGCYKGQTVPECKTKNVTDVYKEVHRDVADQGKTILTEFQVASKALVEELKKCLDEVKNAEDKEIEELSDEVKKKIQKLLFLDPSFGSHKRKSALYLQHQTRSALDKLHCDVLPRMKRVQNLIDVVERDALCSIDRAISLVTACRNCKNPQTLKKCVEENAKYAMKILNKTSQATKLGLSKVEAAQREVLDYQKTSISDLMDEYRKRNGEFSKHLDDCIFAAKSKIQK